MHLALVIASLSAGGAERVLCDLANHWVSQGHQVSLITLLDTGSDSSFYFLNPQIRLISLKQKNSGLLWSFYTFKAIIKIFFYLRKAIRDLRPDLVISFMDLSNILTLVATWSLTPPVIISERIDPQYRPLPPFIKLLRLLIYPRAYQLIVQTESVAAYFPKRFRNFMSIIPNVVKPQLSKVKISKEVRRIISVGRLDIQKDQQTLIQAFADLLKIFPSLELVIYGEGKERKNLEALIRNLGLKDSVKLPGVVSDIAAVLYQADLFVFPSRYEGFPNALCEAMAVGLPVIASNCSGNRDVVRNGVDGFLFPVGNVLSLTTVMVTLINDFEQRNTISMAAAKIIARFEAQQIYALWDEQICI